MRRRWGDRGEHTERKTRQERGREERKGAVEGAGRREEDRGRRGNIGPWRAIIAKIGFFAK